ncbi:MAG: ExeA family protein [Candidatus Binatia bacterium]
MYLNYFGLRDAPFNLTPDPKFFYGSQLHREAFAALYYGIKNKKGFVVVTGEVGTGKTTLLRKLLRSLEATHHSVFIFNTLLNFDELLETILRDLDINQAGAGRVALLESLNEFLLEKVRIGHMVSVLIDEAQHLTEDVLEGVRLLSNMETDRDKLIQIILVGQPELEAKLNRPSLRQLKQRVSLWSRLERLSPADTEIYIRHRLGIAGYQGPDIFDASGIRLICEHASGTPRLINAICDNALLTAFAVSQKVVSEEIIHEVVRDLRLTRESDAANWLWPEPKGVEQTPPKTLWNKPGVGDIKGKTKVRGPEDPTERSRMARSTRAPGGADVAHNLGLKWEQPDANNFPYQQELKRPPAKNVSIIAKAKERRNGDRERPLETDDISGIDDGSGDGAFFGPRDTSARQRIRGPLVPAAFFAKMIQSLTDAMGPMASLVLKEQIAGLRESPEEFPILRLPELVAAIKKEILSENLRLRFENEIAKEIQEHSKPAAPRSSAR